MAPVPEADNAEAMISFDALPEYAIKHCPLLHLDVAELYWPTRMQDFVRNCRLHGVTEVPLDFPEGVEGTIASLADPRSNEATYLTSTEDPKMSPRHSIFTTEDGKPDATGRSHAPCWMIVVDKSSIIGPGVVDIFYFFFYAYNLGPTVAKTHFGNHIGDWENVMIRFHEGVPQAVHTSAHSVGDAYTFNCLPKKGDRPVIYVARGSHAHYPKAGTHDYSGIPFGPSDYTSKGPLWDPSLNYTSAIYHPSKPVGSQFQHLKPCPSSSGFELELDGQGNVVRQAGLTPLEIVTVLEFRGHFGNYWSTAKEEEEAVDPLSFFSFTKRTKKTLKSLHVWDSLVWVVGPTGPRDKTLTRAGMCWKDLVGTKTSIH